MGCVDCVANLRMILRFGTDVTPFLQVFFLVFLSTFIFCYIFVRLPKPNIPEGPENELFSIAVCSEFTLFAFLKPFRLLLCRLIQSLE